MSQWTHINASIRFDSILGMGIPTEKELGKICRWTDEDTAHWHTTIVPCGSEGSLEYSIVNTGGENSVAANVVVFAGDLRSYNDVDEILEYFETITQDKMIRSGILEINVEFSETLMYRFADNKWNLVSTIKDES